MAEAGNSTDEAAAVKIGEAAGEDGSTLERVEEHKPGFLRIIFKAGSGVVHVIVMPIHMAAGFVGGLMRGGDRNRTGRV